MKYRLILILESSLTKTELAQKIENDLGIGQVTDYRIDQAISPLSDVSLPKDTQGIRGLENNS